jgi:hypothetical protein
MIGFYARTFQSLNTGFWRFRTWAHLHPWWARILTIVVIDLYIVIFGNVLAAHADTASTPFMLGGDITDSAGIPLSNYAKLPIDRGDMFSWEKALIAAWLDPIWTGHIAVLSWMIWFCNWLLSFEWVSVIAAPFELLATLLKQFLGDIAWIPFALVISGGVAGIAIMVGKHAGGWSEVFISATCAVLATGMLANPIATLTATGGALDTAQRYGGEIAAAVVSEDFNNYGQNLDTKHLLASAVTSQLVDVFVRAPAQTIAFGKSLDGQCATSFNDSMIASPPINSGNEVRDAVNNCDPQAKRNNENPNFGQVLTAATLSTSNFTIFGFPIIAGFMFLITVIGFLISAMKTMWHVYLGILPINRYPLWRSLGDTVMGLVAIMMMAVVMAAVLKIVVSAVSGIAGLGLPLVGQALFMDMMLVVVLFMMWRTRRAAKKAGRTMAEQLSRLGLGKGGTKERDAVKAVAAMGAVSTIASAALRRPDQMTDNRSISWHNYGHSGLPTRPLDDIGNLRPVPGGPGSGGPSAPLALSGPQHGPGGAGGHAGALPAGGDAGTGPRGPLALTGTKGKVVDAAFTAARIAKGAKAGVPGVIAAAAVEAGSRTVQAAGNHAAKAAAEKNGHAPAQQRSRPSMIVAQESSRIFVDKHGTGHVRPPAPKTPVFDISSLPPAAGPSARSLAVREMLTASGR